MLQRGSELIKIVVLEIKNVLLDWNDFRLNNYKTFVILVAKWYLLTYFLFQYKFDHTKVYATPSKGQDFVSYLTVLSFFL